MWSEFLDQLNDSANWSRKEHKIAAGTGCNRISYRTIDGPKLARLWQNRFAVAADDGAAESMFLEGESERAPDEAGADNSDLMEGSH